MINWKDYAVVASVVLSWISPRGTEENHEKSQSEKPKSRPRFNPLLKTAKYFAGVWIHMQKLYCGSVGYYLLTSFICSLSDDVLKKLGPYCVE
jgi:hypothetical protein